jgi:citrate synthase
MHSRVGSRDMNKWETAISKIISTEDEEEVIIRGHRLSALVGKVTFSEMMFLLMKGELPSKGQTNVLDALLVASMEHGISPPAMLSRCLASYGSPIQAAIAAGVLVHGDVTGGAGEQFAKMLVEHVEILNKKQIRINEESLRDAAKEIIEGACRAGQRVVGFGIPLHKKDPRAPAILRIAEKEGVFGTYCQFAKLIEEELEKIMGRRIPMNIDGVGGAILLDLGFSWQSARIFIITPRTVAMGVHYLEEMGQQTKWRHLRQDQVQYIPEMP